MSEHDKNRRHERFSTDNVRGSFSYSVEAHVLNISVGGFAVRTHTQLNIGRKYRFRLGQGTDAVQLTGVVRWCRLSGTDKQSTGDIVPVYEAGIAFEEVLSEKAEELFDFMEKSIILDVKRRVFGRFKVEDDDTVTLESDSRFQVTQLSLSGMKIETDVALKPETVMELEMQLGRRNFSTPACVVYLAEIHVEGDTLRYRMGVEFLDTAPKELKTLESFIRRELGKGGRKRKSSRG